MSLAKLVETQDIRVLMVEDSSGDAAAMTKALVVHDDLHYNFCVTRAKTLAKGTSFLQQNRVDVVLLDLGLPDARDLEAVTEIHTLCPDTPIVVISGYSNINIIHGVMRSGAQEFLVKGECSNAAIRQSIYQAIARKQIELAYQRGERL